MGFEQRPEKIKDAIKVNDTEALSRAGRKGAEITNAIKKRERERAEIFALQKEIEIERRKMEDTQMDCDANKHIISEDGEDQDYSQ